MTIISGRHGLLSTGEDLPLASNSASSRRRWTTNRRRRHGLDTNDNYYLCDQDPETIDRIIASCSFSRQIWLTILAVLGVNALGVDASQVGGLSILTWWEQYGDGDGTATRRKKLIHCSPWWLGRYGKRETLDASKLTQPPFPPFSPLSSIRLTNGSKSGHVNTVSIARVAHLESMLVWEEALHVVPFITQTVLQCVVKNSST